RQAAFEGSARGPRRRGGVGAGRSRRLVGAQADDGRHQGSAGQGDRQERRAPPAGLTVVYARRVRLIALLAVLAGCGRYRFDGGPDAAGDDAIAACKMWSEFSTPTQLPGPLDSPQDDWAPALFHGELGIVFFSFRTG